MHEYIFRFPHDTPPMTYTALAARLRDRWYPDASGRHHAKIGATVTLRWHTADQSAVMVRLYETTIAILADDGTIRFPNDDPHYASTYWIEKIIADNGLGCRAGRIRRRKSDGPGPQVARGQAGLLCIDFDRDKPVHGRVHHIPAARKNHEEVTTP